jgi:hypothetical protein
MVKMDMGMKLTSKTPHNKCLRQLRVSINNKIKFLNIARQRGDNDGFRNPAFTRINVVYTPLTTVKDNGQITKP